ncbi:MAG: FmdE family protein [Desulfovibrionales bacterium]|nr:FmdE family protein [Desulfovibrionales bacterium]
MSCSFDQSRIDATIAFHGHFCPGLAIGIRTAELAFTRLNVTEDTHLVCVTETDMCGVDAIQFLTPCTYGKGNLVHRDYGKAGFTFFDRTRGEGFRAVFRDEAVPDDPHAADPKAVRAAAIMAASLGDLFEVKSVAVPPVKPAQILASMVCAHCGEKVMESRIRRYGGKDLCIPCFQAVEQKI